MAIICQPCQLYNHTHATPYKARQAAQSAPAIIYTYYNRSVGPAYNRTCATLEPVHHPAPAAQMPDTTATPDAVQASAPTYYNKVYKGVQTVSTVHDGAGHGAASRRIRITC